MKMEKKQMSLLAIIVLGIVLFLCIKEVVNKVGYWIKRASFEVELSPEEAYDKMNNARELVFEGDFKRANQEISITADGEPTGMYIESGILKPKVTITSGDTDLFSFVFGEAELTDRNIATTFVYYGEDDNVVGYAQETAADLPEVTNSYAYLFYDGEQQQQSYYLEDESNCIYDLDGNLLVEGVLDFDFNSSLYTITLKSAEGMSVDMKSKALLVNRMLSTMNSSSLYKTD